MRAHLAFLQILAERDLTVAVGFIPRTGDERKCVAERRLNSPNVAWKYSNVAPRRNFSSPSAPWTEVHGYHRKSLRDLENQSAPSRKPIGKSIHRNGGFWFDWKRLIKLFVKWIMSMNSWNMTAPRPKESSPVKIILCVALLGIGILGWSGFRQMRQARDYSAHAALAEEIRSNLVFLSYSHAPFPRSLSDLPLRYPDGGDSSLLRRFDYSSSGTNCTVRTRFTYEKEDTVWSF